MRSFLGVLTVIALAGGLAAPLRADDSPAAFDPTVARRITPAEVQKRRDAGEKAIILDTRPNQAGGIIHGAVHVPGNELETWAKDVRKDALIVAYCT